MARRTWKQVAHDLDTAIVDVWTGEQLSFKRALICFRELFKALKGGRESWADVQHRELMNRFKIMDNPDDKKE